MFPLSKYSRKFLLLQFCDKRTASSPTEIDNLIKYTVTLLSFFVHTHFIYDKYPEQDFLLRPNDVAHQTRFIFCKMIDV